MSMGKSLQEFVNWLVRRWDKGKGGEPVNPPWFEIALGEIGQKEIAGMNHNPRLLEYHKATRIKSNLDETPWCAAFVNWCLLKAKIKGTGHAHARSFLAWGLPISINEIKVGDIVVFKRGKEAWQGHVGFYYGPSSNPERILVLGGNQGDAVSIQSFSKGQLLGIRRPQNV